MIDERARTLLKVLIERYIADGQPVGSRTLSKHPGLDLSPATIRNVMADLEDAGFIASPHTSAGRIPTSRGYRLFVDTLLSVRLPEPDKIEQMEGSLDPSRPQQLIATASQLLSHLTHFAGIVVAPRREAAQIRQIEFIGLSEKRVLLIIVTANGDVQNRILFTHRNFSQSELTEAANTLNQNFIGMNLGQIRGQVQAELRQLKGELQALTSAALEASDLALQQDSDSCVISGEKNLLDVEEFSTNMKQLRELFDLFEQRTRLMQILDISNRADGVQIYIGGESGLAPLDECSVIAAPYSVNGQVVGTVGVIGPTRMAYERIIPIVDVTARLLSSALTYQHQR